MTVLGRDINRPSSANTIFAMVIIAFGTGLFCAVGAIAQYNGGSLIQLMFGSYAIQFLIAIAWWCIRKPRQATHWYGDSPHKCNIWTRGALFWITMFAWWKGLEMVPIGDAEAIIFVSPMLTIFFAKLWLKEQLPKTYPIILILTAVALIFICQPTFLFNGSSSYTQVSWPGMIFLMACVIAWSATSLLVRTAKEAHWLQVNIVNSFLSAWILTPILGIINHYVGNNLGNGNGDPASNSNSSNVAWIDGADFDDWDWSASTMLAILSMAFFQFFAVTCKVVGYQLGEATKVASMEYMDIVFAFAFQYFMFHRTPNVWEFIGAGLLIFSCAIQFIEEKYFPKEENSTENSNGETQSLLVDTEIGDITSKYDSITDKDGEDSFMVPLSKLDLCESSYSHINFDGNHNLETFKNT